MKPGRGSHKGSSFERDICKKLSMWWTRGARDDIFWRTAGSGARATTRQKVGKSTARSYGDVIAIDPIGDPLIKKITIEIKRGYNKNKASGIDPLYILDGCGEYDLLTHFWEKLNTTCSELGTEPWLIFRRDRCDSCLVSKSKRTDLDKIEVNVCRTIFFIYDLDQFLYKTNTDQYK